MFCNILQKYVQKMQKLRRGEKGNEGPAPHKPLLLLAVIDLIRQGQIDENRIFPFPNLAETFLKYWSNVVANRASNFAMPFFHLKGDKFWHLCPNPGKEDKLNRHRKVNSISWIHEVVAYASLDEALFVLLTNSQDREVICQTLINKYFPNSKQEIESLIAEEQQIGEYRQLLIQEVAEHTVLYEEQTEPIEKENPNRSEAFRREIMRIYNYTIVARLSVGKSCEYTITPVLFADHVFSQWRAKVQQRLHTSSRFVIRKMTIYEMEYHLVNYTIGLLTKD